MKIPDYIANISITPEEVTAFSTFILMLATIALVFVTYKTVGEWKQERRYDAFQSYQEKLTQKETAAFDVLIIINTLRDSKESDKNNAEYFNIFKLKLREKCLVYADISMKTKNDIFLYYSNKQIENALDKMIKIDTEFIEKIRLIDSLHNSKEINFIEINNIYKDLSDSINDLILKSAESIKTKETIKL